MPVEAILTPINEVRRISDGDATPGALSFASSNGSKLEEIRRILKSDGLLFLGVPNSQTSWKKLQRSVGISSFSDPDHKVEYSEKSIRDLLKKHNFAIVNFGYGKFDTPLRGIADIIGGFSITLYKKISDWRTKRVIKNPQEASGFEIVVKKL